MDERKKEDRKCNTYAEERELLRRQLKLLAEKSKDCYSAKDIAIISEQMVNIYRALIEGECSHLVTMIANRLLPETV